MADASLNSGDIERMVAWRRDIHSHPELAFAEHRTADMIARELDAMGFAVRTGLGGTGVVGTLSRGSGPTLGLRSEMDALPIREQTGLPYASKNPGVMHACGHDGHMAMLLGAAGHLARRPDLGGTVHIVFQPAEEHGAGGDAMVKGGLFRDFPCDSIWGLHNWPGLPLGTFASRVGPIMASLDTFELRVRGTGTHAAMPDRGVDPCVIASEIVLALQTIVSRKLDPLAPVVVSVTQIHGGEAYNVIPDEVVVRGTVRCLDEAVRSRVGTLIAQVARGIAETHGGRAEIDHALGYPVTVNAEEAVPRALRAAGKTSGIATIRSDLNPSMGSEDFSFMLQVCPGAYSWLGVDGTEPSKPLHASRYDFNDDALVIGANYWLKVVEEELSGIDH